MIKTIASLLAAASLVGCGQATTTPTPQAENVETIMVNAKPAAQAAQADPQVTTQMLVGRWGDNGDCAKDIVFGADGTFRSYTGGGGSWSLSDDRVTMSGAGGTFEVRVELLNQNTLMIANPDGSFGTSQRC